MRRFEKEVLRQVIRDAIRTREKKKDILLQKNKKITYSMALGYTRIDDEIHLLTKEIEILLKHYQEIQS